MMADRTCAWCQELADEPLEPLACGEEQVYAHPAHREAVAQYCRAVATAQWRFLGGVAACVLAAVAGALLWVSGSRAAGGALAGVAIAACAVIVLKYPFVTPETIALLGIRRSIRVAKASAVALLVLAAAVVVRGFA